jgi:hypothetical protein
VGYFGSKNSSFNDRIKSFLAAAQTALANQVEGVQLLRAYTFFLLCDCGGA